MTGVTIGTGPANPIGAPELTPGFYWGSCYSTINFLHILAIVDKLIKGEEKNNWFIFLLKQS
jgi:hypothetical protein